MEKEGTAALTVSPVDVTGFFLRALFVWEYKFSVVAVVVVGK